MNRHFLLLLASVLASGNVAAQLSPGQKAETERRTAITMRGVEVLGEAQLRAYENCDSKQARVRYPYAQIDKADYFKPAQETMREAVVTIGWTGGCKDGKRDGDGELSVRTERNEAPDNVTVADTRHEGRMVAGRKIGLWCMRDYQFSINGKPFAGSASSIAGLCGLATGKWSMQASAGSYRKLPDGRWQLWGGTGPAEPASFLAAGELEARSEKMIAAALAGETNIQAEVRIETRALDDLVRGAKITLAPDSNAISLKDKRVAVLLSNQTLAELERFKRERQALIEKTLGMGGDAAKIRARFITASNPDRMPESVAKLLRGYVREVVPADSLAGMREAGLDYALVLDWKSLTRMDLLGKYDAFPVGKVGDTRNALLGHSLSAYLISPDLRAVRQYVGGPSTDPKHFSGSGVYDSGDSGYLFRLAQYFESAWGKSADDPGRMVFTLKFHLDRN